MLAKQTKLTPQPKESNTMNTVITVEAKDFGDLLDLVTEHRDSVARIIADVVAEGGTPSKKFVERYQRFERIIHGLINSEEIN